MSSTASSRRIEMAWMHLTRLQSWTTGELGRRGSVADLIRDPDCNTENGGQRMLRVVPCALLRDHTHGATTSPRRPALVAVTALTAYRWLQSHATWLRTLPRRAQDEIRGGM